MTESENPTDMRELAQTVQAARKRRGWTQKDLAEKADVYFGTISNFERGITVPQPHHLRAILHALDLEGDAGDDQAAQTRGEWDADVKTFVDMVALFLMALPPEERRTVMFDMTRQIVNR